MEAQHMLSPLLTQPSLEDIRESHSAIRSFIHETPVLSSEQINKMAEADIHFKCENFQKIGAFKMRGAANAAVRLSQEERQQGLCTHSSGNHAQAVARSAQLLRIPAYIVMPENAPAIKRRATSGYGAQIIPCGPTPADREAKLEEVRQETNAYFIHPYNDYNVIGGQATAALELWEQKGPFDCVLAPVGGGGLLSGTALTVKSLDPSCKVYGAEPKRVDDAFRSYRSGTLQTNDSIDTIADGLRTNLGDKTFQIILQQVDGIFTVEETEIVNAMRLIWERMKIIIEPSCAVPLAAVLKAQKPFKGKKIGIILTGGNVDLDHLPF